MLSIVAVVVTYNRIKLLKECLEALDAQTYPIEKIVIVDNCSTDGTKEWLQDDRNEKYQILLMDENVGGAGGFNRGIKEACNYSCDYVLVLDDDCILNKDYVEKLLKGQKKYKANENKKSPNRKISALCGIVYENGRIAVNHRGYMIKHRYAHMFDCWREYDEAEYEHEFLKCDIASFCGLMISREVIRKVGYPKANYFIKCDDTEYSLRLCKMGSIININGAVLTHKIKLNTSIHMFDWKYYYNIRNGIDMTKKNKLYFCALKIILGTFKVAISEHEIKRWMCAIKDGYKGNLGRREYK